MAGVTMRTPTLRRRSGQALRRRSGQALGPEEAAVVELLERRLLKTA